MKRTYNLLGYLLLGIAAYAFVNANNTNVIATSPATPIRGQAEETTPTTPNRHTITLVLSQLSDLKVEEGTRINVGDIISDRTTERTKLQAKKQRLETAIAQAKLPLRELKPVPSPSFQIELASLKQAQFNLDQIARQISNFDQKIYHKDPWHVQVFESEKVQELADLKRKELEASINVEKAIASLDEAKLNYQKQQYEHSLKVSDYQTSLQKQQEQVNSLQTQLDTVDDELDKLTSVYSPYRGKVRRVKILGQNERSITAEVTLDIRGEK
jgi:multidrug efflux pump subunit AcrA (membrane-fusion protein)